jgi:ABC-type sugar transport system ATPase subunit
MTTLSAGLSLQGLCKTYQGNTAVLENIDLEIKSGEFVVLVGPSGCGKSTLLRMIAGLEDISSGTLKIGDRDVSTRPPAERNIAMVFQDYALYPHMSVKENLSFGLRIQKVEPKLIEQRVQKAAEMLGLQTLLARKPSELSGGQRQRVAIGRAIVRAPQVFLFDEPLSNLDAQLRAKTRIELATLHQQLGTTVIYVTHDQVEAMTLASRIVVLHKGRIQQVGAPLELYNHPANKFVASFIGNPSMNFFQGTLKKQGGGKVRFETSGQSFLLDEVKSPKQEGEYLLGLRPEALKVLAKEGRESQGNTDLEVKVDLLEPHGHEAHLVAHWGPLQLIIRSANPHRLERIMASKRGDILAVTLDQNALHWFEPSEPHARINDLTTPALAH